MQIILRELCKTAEPIEMQFGLLSQVSSGNMHYMGCSVFPHGKNAFGLSGRLNSIRFGGGGKRVSCAKTDGPVLKIYTSCDVFFFVQEVAFGVAMIAFALKFSVALNLIAIDFFPR